MLYELAYFASRALGGLFLAGGLLMMLASIFGMLAGAGGPYLMGLHRREMYRHLRPHSLHELAFLFHSHRVTIW